MKNIKLNPLDQMISRLADEFSKIPNYQRDIQDPDLKRVHTFTAVRLTGIYSTKDLLLKSFLPKTNELIIQTKNHIRTSMYKHILDTIDFDAEELRHETIRLGYVMVFHKYEVFIKDLYSLLDELSERYKETNEPLEKYGKRKLDFNAREWHNFPIVHQVNFISNCTKHQDGFCKLDNPKHTKPKEFANHPDNQKIIRTTQDFKNDVELLLQSIQPLINIIALINLLRTHDNLDATYEFEGKLYPLYTNETKQSLAEGLLKTEDLIKGIINGYKNVTHL